MSKETPYLAIDFDVLEKVGPAGAACGLSEERVFLALGKLWLYCWRNKTEHVTTTHLLGFFYGVSATDALLTFGFIAASPEGWRVKGADRWLFVQKARSENGKAQSGNLKRGTHPGPGKLPAPPIESPAGLRQVPGTPPGRAPALTASSVKRPTSNEEEDLPEHPLQALWNLDVVPRAPRCPRWTVTQGARLRHADARLVDHPEIPWWRDTFDMVVASDFLSGRKNDFKTTPDWIVNPTNLLKVREGNYSNGAPGKGPVDISQMDYSQGATGDF